MQRFFETELHFEVKTYDVDFVGFVHNLVYIRWLEDLRTAMMKPHYPVARCLAEGVSPILIETTIQYRRPLKLGDEFIGRVWLTELQGVRWTVMHELIHNDRLIATATQKGTFIDLATHRPVPPPEEFVRKFVALQHLIS